MQPILNDLRIVAGKGADNGVLAMILNVDEYANDPAEPHGIVVTWKNGVITRLGVEGAIALVDIDFLGEGTEACMAVGDTGEVRIYRDGEIIEEQIPLEFGKVRCLKRIGSDHYAVGLGMEAYRRKSGGTWEYFGPDDAMIAEFGRLRFESIDGFGPNEIYVAGDAGILWFFNGVDWLPVECQTNAIFTCLHCARDGKVYVGGQAATLAIGRTEDFQIVTTNSALADIWGVAWHDGSVYAALDRALVVLDEDNEFVPDHVAMETGDSFYDLHSLGDTLWCFGMKDVTYCRNGDWQRIDEGVVG